MTQTALILGARGKIGRHFSKAFADAGWQVRPYSRGTDMRAAARGCDVIVNGLNPPAYHDWDRQLPQITAQVIDAAKTSGGTVLFPGNVYVFGTEPGPWDQDTPHRPVARKGRIRADVEARYRAAAEAGVRTILLRAGDFIDPDGDDDVMGLLYLRSLSRGRVTTLGNPDVPRAHAFLPDMARAGVMLAERRADLPPFTDVPFEGLTFSTSDLIRALERLTGQHLKTARFPWALMTLAAPVWELARELREMRYLYDTPHRLSGARLAALLPDFAATPLDQVLRRVLARRQPAAAALPRALNA